MTIRVEQYVRKSFPVDAIRVTAQNMVEVAEWCDGTIRTEPNKGKPGEVRHIKVRVDNPLTERQTKAYVGDWILYAGKGYKIYTDKAFRHHFDHLGIPLPQGIEGSVVVDAEGGIPHNIFQNNGAGGNGSAVTMTSGTTGAGVGGGGTHFATPGPHIQPGQNPGGTQSA